MGESRRVAERGIGFMRLARRVVLPIAMLAVVSCSKTTPEPEVATTGASHTGTSTGDIEKTALESAYPMEHLGIGVVRLAGGAYQDSAGSIDVRLVRSALGDINGDNVDDAAVVLATQSGGTGIFMDLFAVLGSDRGSPARGPAALGDRVKVDSMRVVNGAIVLHLVVHSPEDPLCCPTQHEVGTFVLQADTLMRRPSVELP
jgi:hypothetical protein